MSLAYRWLGSGVSLRAGIGVATGPAFVGNIRAADRLIWSALGSTTNLAARLQGLTRELEAGILIDETTRRRAGRTAAAFRSLAPRQIRGHGAEELYAL